MQLDINLLDPTLRPRKVLVPARQLAPALGAVALLLVGWAGWQSREAGVEAQAHLQLEARATALQAEIRQLSDQVGSRKVSPEVQARATAREALRGARETAMAALRTEGGTTTGGHARYLRALARQAVDGLWLTEVTVNGTGRDIALRGRALAPELVADYLRRLGQEDVLHGIAFNQLEFRRPAAGEAGAVATAPPRFLEFGVTTLAGTDNALAHPSAGSAAQTPRREDFPPARANELAAVSQARSAAKPTGPGGVQ